MKTPKAPPAPDPAATAAAQSQMNRETAITQAQMNMIDQVGPDGSLKYTQTGTWSDGTPRYLATQSLSDSGERINNINNQTEENIATIGRDQSARIGELLSSPVNLDNKAVEDRLWELGSSRLTPQFAKDEEALRTRLANSGVQAGSAAWNSEFERLTQAQTDARNQLLLNGRGQAIQEILTERNQPINEITALLNGSQVSQPNFVNTPQTQVAGTDYLGAVNSAYQGQMQAYQQKVASNNAMMGGLFGLAGTIGKAAIPMISDRRLKRDIERVGTLPNGLPTYHFRYLDHDTVYHGLMSDDVRKLHPDAVVVMPNGFDAVYYDKAVL